MKSQLNWVETLPYYILFTLISSFYFPIPALAAIWAITFGRVIYTIGNLRQSKYRSFGTIFMAPAILMILSLSIASAIIAAVRFNIY